MLLNYFQLRSTTFNCFAKPLKPSKRSELIFFENYPYFLNFRVRKTDCLTPSILMPMASMFTQFHTIIHRLNEIL